MPELRWAGKYDEKGVRVPPLRVPLPFQTVETVNASAQERQRALDLFAAGGESDWRNRLIWGDKKYVNGGNSRAHRVTSTSVYEIDFIPVGNSGRHGDAIAIRFTRPDTNEFAHLIIDAGFGGDGDDLVAHVRRWYQTDQIDLAILTHPDGDHIGGMGEVLRGLDVRALCLHRIGSRGGESLRAAEAVDELITLAGEQGTAVVEAFAGAHDFGGALQVLGPTEEYYEELVAAQVAGVEPHAGGVAAAVRRFGRRFLSVLPDEVYFDDAGGTNPRNNSCMILLLKIDGKRFLFPADSGVPALERAWDWAEQQLGDGTPPWFVQIPHHGSRKNVSSALLNRILGPTGQARTKSAFVNVAPEAEKHPAARVANAFMRRGYAVGETKGKAICERSVDAPQRPGWQTLVPLDPMDESEDE